MNEVLDILKTQNKLVNDKTNKENFQQTTHTNTCDQSHLQSNTAVNRDF